jgi:hypothetical protein
MKLNIAQKLEEYTLKKLNEVLLIEAEIEGEKDQIIIFKGFSSSLMRPTSFDPDIPVLPATAKIIKIDRLIAPYNPDQPNYIQQGLTWKDMEKLFWGS